MKMLLKLAVAGAVGAVSFASVSMASLKTGDKAPDFSAPAYPGRTTPSPSISPMR